MTRISTHVLDSARGEPVCGMKVTLSRVVEGQRIELARTRTANDGRIENLCATGELEAGVYCLQFATGEYYAGNGATVFYPHVDVVFNLDGNRPNCHIPLVFSPFGYSTYMGA